MKKLLLFLMSFIFACACWASESTMVFEKEIHDFGNIKELNGSVSYTFKFKNNGSSPFVIENISVSCGCTSPEYDKKPVMPGESRELKITFNPEGRPGDFLKEIYVLSANAQNKNTLKIKGTVLPKPRSEKDDYPVELSGGLRLSSLNLGFMYVARGSRVSQVVKVRNFSDKKSTLKVDSSSKYLELSQDLTLKPNENGDLTISYNVPFDADYGTLIGQVNLDVNGIKQAFVLSTSAYVVDEFDGEGGAKADFSSQYLSLGSMAVGQSASRSVVLSNKGDKELVVRAVELPEGITSSLKAGDVVSVGESLEVDFEFKPVKSSRYTESVIVIFNDAQRPMREIRFIATVI